MLGCGSNAPTLSCACFCECNSQQPRTKMGKRCAAASFRSGTPPDEAMPDGNNSLYRFNFLTQRARLLQQIGISAPQVGQGGILGKGTKQRHRSTPYCPVDFRLRALTDESRSRPPRCPCPNCERPWKSGRSDEDRPLPFQYRLRSRPSLHPRQGVFLEKALRFLRATACRDGRELTRRQLSWPSIRRRVSSRICG